MWEKLGSDLVATLAFTGVGLVFFLLAFWIMDKLAPFSIRKEIEEDQNISLAIIMAAVIMGISLIIFGSILG